MAKTLNTNSKRLNRSKNVIHAIPADHIERIRFFEAAMNEQRALQLSNDMIEWGEANTTALFENEFLVLRKISQKTWQIWKKRYPVLQEASDYLKTIFAARRELMAIRQDQKFLSSSMHLYSTLFADDKALEYERKKELKNIATKNGVDMEKLLPFLAKFMAPLE